MYGSDQDLKGTACTVEPCSEPSLNMLLGRMRRIQAPLGYAIENVGAFLSRVEGPRPEACADNAKSPPPASIIGEMNTALDIIETLANHAANQSNRLTNIA